MRLPFSILVRACPPPYQSGVGLSGTLSIPLSLHYVQTTPPIPHAKKTNEQTKKNKYNGASYLISFTYQK